MTSNGSTGPRSTEDDLGTEDQYLDSSPGQRVPVCSPNKEPFNDKNVEEFSKFCCLRSIPKDVKRRACHYLQEFTEQELISLLPGTKELFALIIYLAEIDTRLPYGTSDPHLKHGNLDPPSISVTDILQMTGVNINELFHVLNMMREKTTLPGAVITHLKKMEKNYCVVAALFNTFESRLCQSVFRDIREDGEEDDFLPPIPETEGVSFRKRQCWALFLLSRYHLLQDNPELFLHFQLLLCCVEFVLRQTPSFLLNSPYDSIRFGCFSTQEAGITMLGKLAEKFQVASDGTLQLHLERTEPYFQSLLNKDGELDSDSLCEEYEKIYHKERDLDELQFLTKESHLMPVPLNKVNPQSSQSKASIDGCMTPVRQAVSTVDSLHKHFGSGPEKSTEKLCQYYQKCPQDPTSKIAGILESCKGLFVKAFQDKNPDLDSGVAEQRFVLGLKIYHTVLEALLNAESNRLTSQILGTLLNKEDFHKSVLVCSLEIVLTTYGQSLNHANHEVSMEESSMAFPWLLGVLSLHAYDFLKVIALFIKAERRLPIDVVKHLQSVEIRILEQEAWKEGSPVFAALTEQREAGLATPPRLLSPVGSPTKSQIGSPAPGTNSSNGHRDSLDLFLSPVKGVRHQSASVPSSNQLPFANYSTLPSPSSSAIGEEEQTKVSSIPRQSQSLSSFINSVCRLGFSRMSKLCAQLECSKDLQHKIWTCLEHCVTKMPFLLKNRHLDQIIMCCIYGLCKVTEHDILFKEIVTLYREMPGAKQETCKEVYLSEGSYESIITFYNNIFMLNIKPYILQFAPQASARPRLSPMPKQVAASPHYSLPGNKNFMISPLKESPFKAPQSPSKMTPNTRLLYSFPENIGGLDSAEKLKNFKHQLEMKQRTPGSVKKRLNLDDGPPAKSPRR